MVNCGDSVNSSGGNDDDVVVRHTFAPLTDRLYLLLTSVLIQLKRNCVTPLATFAEEYRDPTSQKW